VKNLSKKSVSLVLIFAILMTIFMPSIVNAETGQQTSAVVVTNEELKKESTVYAGEVFVNGESQMQWLYSNDISNKSTVFENLREALPTNFATLIPATVSGDGNGLSVSTQHQADMNSNWTSASYVASQYYTGDLGTETNANLYDINTTYKNNIDTAESKRQEEVTNPQDFGKRIVSVISSSVDNGYVMTESGIKSRHTITFGIEATTVNYTRVDVTTNSTPTKINTEIASPKVGDTAAETTYEYIEGANQTYTIGEDGATFRINADYSLFENGGKVYVDDTLVSSDNYSSKTGSTIITFTKDYMSSLPEGEHTLKVAFNNGGSATTKFTVAKADTTTTMKAAAAKTADALPYVGLVLVFMGAFAIAVVSVRRKF